MDSLYGLDSGIFFENTRLSFIGKDCQKIPPIILNKYGPRVNTLDLSFNSLTTLQGIEFFFHLKELILDNNVLSDNIIIPKMQHLQTLSINKNKIINLELFLHKVQENLPSLKYLSLLGNKACPNQLSDITKDEDDYKRYRYYVINQLPKLKFLDSTPVTKEERQEAERRGHLMKIAKPQNNQEDEIYFSQSTEYTPLPKTKRTTYDHQGAYGKCKYRYSGKHSEGNRFIQNNDL
ncbi:U2 small nuclear ribonucleoprotein A, putative [Pediculus humanus corporis]|uniref:U2 small nuclear ribonucleoprotein A, putative n=1 Tax=Pediculus humanus subsp. corporis TaxID=121224 RepID=E0W407_PEDHC|nr:U2 small nuclear ribonucleoprotein A, putative [Pediculus humanus corporis]EEB20363.1 U2 small nuclear ribonucleoprotein A, putative [Pediculus humanus corporis]